MCVLMMLTAESFPTQKYNSNGLILMDYVEFTLHVIDSKIGTYASSGSGIVGDASLVVGPSVLLGKSKIVNTIHTILLTFLVSILFAFGNDLRILERI